MKLFYVFVISSIASLVIASDDFVQEGRGARQSTPAERTNKLDDQELKELSPVAHKDHSDEEKVDLGIVASEAAKNNEGGSLGTVVTQTVKGAVDPKKKPYTGDLSQRRVQELLKKMYYLQQQFLPVLNTQNQMKKKNALMRE